MIPACLSEPESIRRSPPPMLTVVPGDVNGDRVRICITPLALFGPYNAAPGPETTSICSLSSTDGWD